MYRHLLVPTDGSALSTEMVGRAVDFARSLGAKITFLYARPDFAADQEGALLYSMSPKLFAQNALGDAQAIVAKAEAAARTAHVECDGVIRTTDRPYEAILDTATEHECDLIFMASHGRKGIKGLMLGSQTLKVLADSTIPVLVSTSEANTASPMMSKALSILRDEHRSLTAVLHALNYLVAEVRDKGAKPDFRLFKALAAYVENFSERLHNPKEEDYIFSKLSQRSSEADEVIAQLKKQHASSHKLSIDFKAALLAAEADPVGGFPPFAALLAKFGDLSCDHMNLEENVIMVAARKHLREEDWAEIATAFGANGDPRFGDKVGRDFHDLFAQLLNQVPIAVDE